MSRSVYVAVVVAVLFSATVVAQAPAAVAGGQDVAAGIGEIFVHDRPPHPLTFAFSARSGPSGEDPRGTTGHLQFPSSSRWQGHVSCLAVSGNRAIVGFAALSIPEGQGGYGELVVVDGGHGGASDQYDIAFSAGPPDCRVPQSEVELRPLTSGNIDVHDAAPVKCGDVITEDTTLYADLSECPSGLSVRAAGVTLDLNGHTIDGLGSDRDGDGVLSAYPDVRIEGGTIREFHNGVYIVPRLPHAGAQNNVLRNLAVVHNHVGVSVNTVGGTRVERSYIAWNRDVGMSGPAVRLDQNVLVGNGRGILLSGAGPGSAVTRNRVVGSEGDGVIVQISWPPAEPGQPSVRLVDNAVRGNAGNGILVRDSPGVALEANRVRLNGDDGIETACGNQGCASHPPTLTRNTAHRNNTLGINTPPGTIDGGGNRARGNGDPRQCIGVRCN